jgi:release factor glutamine methyltransferase
MSAIVVPRSDSLGRRAWRGMLRIRLALRDRKRYEQTVLERIGDLNLVVLPDVFNPVLLRSGAFLVEQVRRLSADARVLDLGSGSGACGIAAARRGCEVTAVDINPSAVRCTRINALLNDVDLDVRSGDLFEPIAEERFHVVLFNPPYYRGTPRDGLDHAWRSTDVPERFAAELPNHLTKDGYALVVLSTDGDHAAFLQVMDTHRLEYSIAAKRDFVNEVMTVYQVAPRC